MSVPVSLLYGGLNALLLTALSINVSLARGRYKLGVASAHPPEFVRPLRAHGNAAEYVPVGLILLLLLELAGVGTVALHVLGGAFLAGRLFHAVGMLRPSPLAAVGAGINYLALLVMSFWAIWAHFGH